MVLECAVAGSVDYIVTGDNHLLDLKDGQRYQLTDFTDHRMIHTLSYDETNRRLLFDYTNNHFRNIGYYSFGQSRSL